MSKTAKDITDNLIQRAMTMKLFLISRPVEKNWLPKGALPFDVKASKGTATFKVYAVSEKEADDLVTQYLENGDVDE